MKTFSKENLVKTGHLMGVMLATTGVALPTMTALQSVKGTDKVNASDVELTESTAQLHALDGGSINNVYFGSVHGEPLYTQWFDATVGGQKCQAYCINYKNRTPNGTASKQGKPSDLQWKILKNGYPAKNASELGITSTSNTWPYRSFDLAGRATQIAIWIASGDFSFNDISWKSDTYSQQVKNAVQKILNDARNDKSSMSVPKGGMKVTGSSVDPNTGETTVTLHATVENNAPAHNTKINIDNLPSGAKIYQNGKEIKNGGDFDESKDVQVKVPGSEKAVTLKAHWTGQLDDEIPQAALYNAPAAGEQSALVYRLQSNMNVKGATDDVVQPTEGSVNVHKVDSANKPVAGVKFELVNKDNKTVASGTTDKDGNLQFHNLLPGQYTLKETDAPIAVRIDHASTNVVVQAGQENKSTVGNTSVKGKIKSDTLADDGLHMTDATKGGNLNETLHLSDVTTNIKLREETKVVYKGTNIPVKDSNGKEIKETHDFDAKQANFDEKIKIPVDYKALQGKEVTTMTTLYRVKGNETLKLDEEVNNADANQSVASLLPTIQTLDTVKANGVEGNQTVNPSQETTVQDAYTATNLIKGHKYSATFTEYVDGKPVTNKDGKPVQVTKQFTANDSTQKIVGNLPKFDTTQLGGKTLTIHADLKAENGDVLATHNDDNDKNEQIHVTKPEMQTQALVSGGKADNPNGAASLSDRVSYNNVTPGQPLNLKVVARDAQGNPIKTKVDGKEYYLMGNMNFTPQSESGTVDVPLMQVNADKVDANTKNTAATVSSTASSTSKNESSATSSSNKAESSTKDTKAATFSSTTDKISTSETNANASNEDKAPEVGKLNTPNKDDWKAVNANDDLNMIKINPINEGDVAADPIKAGHTAGGSDLENPYQINTRSLAGKDIGLSENLLSQDNGEGNVWTTEAHHDAHDSTEQAVHITNPKLHTEALINGSHTDMPSKEAQLFDKVSYSDVVPNRPLEISTMMYDKDNKQPITYEIDGKTMGLVGRLTFTPSESNGEINVPLQQVEMGKDFTPSDLAMKDNSVDSAALRIKENPLQVAASPIQAQVGEQVAQKAADKTNSDNAKKESAAVDAAKKAGLDTDAAKAVANKALADDTKQSATDNKATASSVANNASKSSSTTGSDLGLTNGTTATTGLASDTNKQMLDKNVNGTADATKAANDNTTPSLIDTTKLAGKSMVAVEDLSQYTDSGSKNTIAQNVITSENNLNNDKQTVNITKPEIHTQAAINGGKNFTFEKGKDGKAKISDTVIYKNFVPGKQQKVTIVEMDKSTGKPVQINGKYLVGQLTFTPKQANGSVTVQLHETDKVPAEQYTKQALGEVVKGNESKASTKAATSSSAASSKASSSSKTESSKASSSSKTESSKASSSSKTESSKASSSSKTESSKASSSSKTESSKASSSSTVKDTTDDENKAEDIDLSSLKSDANWVAFETTENVGQGNNITAEGKNLADNNESIKIKPTDKKVTPKTTGQSQVQSQLQSQTQNVNAGGSNGGNSPAGSNGGSNGGGSTPSFAQTGGTGSFNKIVDWFARLFR